MPIRDLMLDRPTKSSLHGPTNMIKKYKHNARRFKTMASQQSHLDELKETRRKLQNLFSVLYQGHFDGKMAEAVFDSLKLVDGMYKNIQSEIDSLEPKEAVKAEDAVNGPATQPEAV